MRKLVLFLLFFTAALTTRSYCQVAYSGTIGKAAVEFVIENYPSNELTYGVYIYKKYNEPIALQGAFIGNTLRFFERGQCGDTAAIITFTNYTDSKSIYGSWKSYKKSGESLILLNRLYNFSTDICNSDSELPNRELLQFASMKNYFFKIVGGCTGLNNSELNVAAVRIYEKKTGKLFQEIKQSARWGSEQTELSETKTIEIGDYNFDGIDDFSFFGDFFGGNNTSQYYVIFDKEQKRFCSEPIECVGCGIDDTAKLIWSEVFHPSGEVSCARYKIVGCKLDVVKSWSVKEQ